MGYEYKVLYESDFRKLNALGKDNWKLVNVCWNNDESLLMATIRTALQFAFQRGFVVNNVADRIAKPKKTIYKGSFYNGTQLKKLYSCAKDTNLEFAVHMASYYGLRREEVC